MDKRGFDSGDPSRHQALMAQKALEMEEALYLQRQQELDRDIQLQRMLIQEQLQKEAFSNSLRVSRLYFGGGIGGSGLAAQYEHELLLQQEQLRRQQLQQQLQAHGSAQSISASGSEAAAEQLVAETVANAARRSSTATNVQRKRSFDKVEQDLANAKRAARSESSEKPKAKPKSTKKSPKLSPTQSSQSIEVMATPKSTSAASRIVESNESAAIEALTAVGKDLKALKSPPPATSCAPLIKGTLNSLIKAAESEDKIDTVAAAMANLKNTVTWDDLAEDHHEEYEIIDFPTFRSTLPRLPKEPEAKIGSTRCRTGDGRIPRSPLFRMGDTEDRPMFEEKSGGALLMTVDYPYPVDSWWPSISAIRKERRMKGDRSDEEDFTDEPTLSNKVPFKGDLPDIVRRLNNETEPGVLEKVPHCRIHRMAMRSLKVASAPDHAFCWQVTENYCNNPMVCCSICSAWRHAACGGHYKPYTAKDSLQETFVPICDRCHAEQELLAGYPEATKRLERQRIEQLRRGLSTSQIVRHASFAKHGGTYKWPLGSVTPYQIAGHTRSVHTRHDKAEKQWSEMVTRLGRGSSAYRQKERVKVRTRELERLLVSVEDAEGYTDRHNMMLFLERDGNATTPVGYEKRKVNIFDPEDDEHAVADNVDPVECLEVVPGEGEQQHDGDGSPLGRRISAARKLASSPKVNANRCGREGCDYKPRFDSLFCSDACGVSALETDLVRSIDHASDIHPSLLRTYG